MPEPSSRGEVVYGVRPVVEALRSKRREVFEVLLATDHEEIPAAAEAAGVTVRDVPKDLVGRVAGNGGHQGVVARVGPYPYAGLEGILSHSNSLVVVLDGVTDPQNLGAVLRVADGAGASGVIIPKDRAAGVSSAVVKASAGASEHVRVVQETNLRRVIDRMKDAGVWVYAAEGGTESIHTDLDMTGPVALVLGSEGKGVRRLVREGCDDAVSIPMLGAVSSLNVSVVAAVLLYEAGRQRGWTRT